jgi:uracil-DNA glycosylase family 4
MQEIDFKEKISGWQNKSGSPEIVIVGLAPSIYGAAINKKPLSSSRSGKLLWSILARANLDSKVIYLTNLIKTPLPDNRPPTDKEIVKNAPLLASELHKIKPSKIIALGKVVSNHFNLQFFSQKHNIISIPHPAYLLHSRVKQNEVVEFLKKAFIQQTL